MTSMRDRNTVAGAQAAEIMPLHDAGKTLADGGAGDVDQLTGGEMRGLDLGAHLEQCLGRNAEFDQLRHGLYLGLGVMTALRLRHVLDLGLAGAELERG